MKRVFIQLNVAILLLLTLSFQCMGADTYTLNYKLETGKTYKQNMVTVMNMKMNVMGQDMSMDMTQEMGLQYDVVGNNNGVFDIKTTYQKIKMNMTSPAPFTIDSDSPENSTDVSLGKVFKSLVGVPLNIQLAQNGKVLSVTGVDKLAAKMDSIDNPQYKQMFGQQFSEKAIQATFERMSSFFPEKPVAIGDTWDVSMSINSSGIDIISKMKITLKEVKDNVASLEYTGTLATPEGGSALQIQGMDATVSMTGEQTGTASIDMKTGWTVRAELTQNSTQEIGISGQSMEQKIETKTTVTGE